MTKTKPALKDADSDALATMVDAVTTGGYTLKDFSAFTDDEMEAAYATGCQQIDQGRYDQAEKVFEFLCRLDHYEGKYWIGLGACRQMQKKYDSAVKSYALAGIHDMENPIPALRAAECYVALGKWTEADSAARAAVYWSEGKGEHERTSARAKVILQGVQRMGAAK